MINGTRVHPSPRKERPMSESCGGSGWFKRPVGLGYPGATSENQGWEACPGCPACEPTPDFPKSHRGIPSPTGRLNHPLPPQLSLIGLSFLGEGCTRVPLIMLLLWLLYS